MNDKKIKTMEELADYINSFKDYFPHEARDIIEQNGWVNDCDELYGICHNKEEILELNEDMRASVRYIQHSTDMTIEDDALFSDKDFFGDEYEHKYLCRCYNGYANCMSAEETKAPEVIKVVYPTLEDLSCEQIEYIKKYRGLRYYEGINTGDIMITYGKIIGSQKLV